MTVIILAVGIPITLLLIFFTIRMGKMVFHSPILGANMIKGQTIHLEDGDYSLWGESQAYKVNRLIIENPILLGPDSRVISMKSTISGANSVTLSGIGRRILYTFSVPSGDYVFDLENRPYTALPKPATKTPVKVSYVIRKKTPLYCYFGFSLGISGSIISLILTIVLAVISPTGIHF
jgi:hypothetical protein